MASAAAAGWQARPARPEDVPGLCALFARAFGKPLPEERWRWKLGVPGAASSWLIERDGRPVCHYAGLPRRCRLAHGEATAMVAVDGMTEPGLRRQGLITAIVEQAHAAWRAAGVALVLGLPNEQWGSRLAALGWQPAFELQWLAAPLDPLALVLRRIGVPPPPPVLAWPLRALWRCSWRLRTPRGRGVDVRLVATAGAELDALAGRLGAEAPMLVRDRAFVGWRYLATPQPYAVALAARAGVPLGYAAWRVQAHGGRRTGVVADLRAASDPGALPALVRAALDALQRERAEAAFALAAPGSAAHRVLRRSGFRRGRGAFRVHFVPLAASLEPRVLQAAEGWELCGGDFDVA